MYKSKFKTLNCGFRHTLSVVSLIIFKSTFELCQWKLLHIQDTCTFLTHLGHKHIHVYRVIILFALLIFLQTLQIIGFDFVSRHCDELHLNCSFLPSSTDKNTIIAIFNGSLQMTHWSIITVHWMQVMTWPQGIKTTFISALKYRIQHFTGTWLLRKIQVFVRRYFYFTYVTNSSLKK